MAKSEPIRCPEDIEQLKNYFLNKGEARNYALIVIGLNTIFKINEILSLRWEHVYDFEAGSYREEIRIKKQGSEREKAALLNPEMIKALEFVKAATQYGGPRYYIFKSRNGENRPISRTRAFTIIKEAARELGMKENISCQSLQKTFGYQAWKQGVQPEYLQAVYHQTTCSITEEYLGIEKEEKEPPILRIQV